MEESLAKAKARRREYARVRTDAQGVEWVLIGFETDLDTCDAFYELLGKGERLDETLKDACNEAIRDWMVKRRGQMNGRTRKRSGRRA